MAAQDGGGEEPVGLFPVGDAIGRANLGGAGKLLDAGLEDLNGDDENYFTVITDVKDLENVKKALDDSGVSYENAKTDLIPENYIELEADDARKVIRLIDALENNDDVQAVYSNMEISESAMSSLNE